MELNKFNESFNDFEDAASVENSADLESFKQELRTQIRAWNEAITTEANQLENEILSENKPLDPNYARKAGILQGKSEMLLDIAKVINKNDADSTPYTPRNY